MDKNKWMLLIGATIAILLAIIIFKNKDEIQESVSSVTEDRDESNQSSSGFSSGFMNFPEAPKPDEDVLVSQAEKLWPHAFEPKDPNRKERVRKEWQDFAKVYPKNLYIPNEIRGTLTPAEEKSVIETLDAYTSIDAKFASINSASKYANPGTEPPAPNQKDVSPKEMTQYFDYKIQEIESRIELLEYTMEKSRLSSIDESTAKNDIALLKKELASLKDVKAQVPNS
jgi:hypothetical protein